MISTTFTTQPAPVSRRNPASAVKSQPSPPRFRGVGEAVSGFIGMIDASRVAELITSDGLGMLVPRSAVAAGFRGADDGRETLIREGAGLVCVALLAGLSNQFMVHTLGNRVGIYNPHGIPAKAWISAKNLRVFSQLYAQALNASTSADGARKAFVDQLFQGMESGDHRLSLQGRLANLKALMAHVETRTAAEQSLSQMMRQVSGESISPAKQAEYLKWLRSGKMDELKREFLAAGWGRLSPQGQKNLLQAYKLRAPGESGHSGTLAFDALAKSRIQSSGKTTASQNYRRDFLKNRLRLSLEHLKKGENAFVDAVDKTALDNGLTSVVNVRNLQNPQANPLIAGQSRKTLLKELKAFLEHYVDRATFEALESKGAQAFGDIQKQQIHQKLFAKSSKGLRALLPHWEDGLVTATMKTKSAYTWLPIGVAIAANGATTFLNNYVTQKKYGGKVFFPGEEAGLKRGQVLPSAQKPAWKGGLA